MEMIFINKENSKINKPHNFVPILPLRLDFKISDRYVAL